MPKISVIVPVYNVEKLLRRCVDSILAQTFTDFELLLINDGSTDGSGDICDEYAAGDPRVRVFHKPNGGVSSARNLGLDNAEGEWITFCDADDYVLPDWLYNFCNTKDWYEYDIINQGILCSHPLDDAESHTEQHYSVMCIETIQRYCEVLFKGGGIGIFSNQTIAQISHRRVENKIRREN